MNKVKTAKPFVDLIAKKKLANAAKLTTDAFKKLESSEFAQTLEPRNYNIPPVYAEPMPTHIQIKEMNGKADSYPSELHKNLI